MYHWEIFNEWIYHIGILVKSLFVPIVCRINPFQVQVQVQVLEKECFDVILNSVLVQGPMVSPDTVYTFALL